LESRIILIADTFDAITSDRPYRGSMPTQKALEELEQNAGTQFDPALTKIALAAASPLDAARREMKHRRKGEYFC